MRQAQTYKPSNTFSFGGFILMFISMLIAGALLSWLYVILQAVIPLIYLCILITIGFGAAIGGIGALFVKVYKIRHPGLAIAATMIAMLFVYIFHWCIYVARDYDKYSYDKMKEQKATSYFLGITDEQLNSATVSGEELAANFMQTYKQHKIHEVQFTVLEKEYFTAREKDMYDRNVSIWEYYDYDKVLGTTVSEVAASLEAIKGKNAYDFYIEYRKQPKHSVGYLLVHPGELWSDICDINSVGRWTMRSSRHSYSSTTSSTSNNNVNGIMLWLTWLGEMALMFVPAAAIVAARAGAPFIEQDNDWAITDKPQLSFKFVDPFPGNSNGEKQFKATFMNDIDSLFTLQPLRPQMGSLNTFYTVNYCHSKFYTENYLTVQHTRVTNARNNQRAVTSIAKKVRVDADYIATLHGMFGYQVPANCPGTNKFAQAQQQEQQPQQDYNTQQNYEQQYTQPQQDYNTQQNYEQQYTQPQQDYNTQQGYEQQYTQPQQQGYQPQYQPMYQSPQQTPAPQEDFSSGDMDGIDTSNIDLSSLDNMQH